jgi:hypothetical protein
MSNLWFIRRFLKMKKVIILVFVLFFGLFVVSSISRIKAKQAAIAQFQVSFPIQKQGIERHNIELIDSQDPTFFQLAADDQAAVKSRIPNIDQRTLDLLPWYVFIKNSSNRIIVGYSVVWDLTKKDGTTKQFVASKYDMSAILGQGNEDIHHPTGLAASSGIIGRTAALVRLQGITNDLFSTDEFASGTITNEQVIQRFNATYSNMVVSLDLVVFENGDAIGPDRTNNFVNLKAASDAHFDLYSKVAKQGRNIDLKSEADVTLPKQANGNSSIDDPIYLYAFHRKVLANELNQALVRSNGEAADKIGKTFDTSGKRRLKLNKVSE